MKLDDSIKDLPTIAKWFAELSNEQRSALDIGDTKNCCSKTDVKGDGKLGRMEATEAVLKHYFRIVNPITNEPRSIRFAPDIVWCEAGLAELGFDIVRVSGIDSVSQNLADLHPVPLEEIANTTDPRECFSDEFYNKAIDFIQHQHFEQALFYLERALLLNPKNYDATLAKAYALSKTGKKEGKDEAIILLDTFIADSNKKIYKAHYIKGIIYYETGDYVNTQESLKAAITSNPNYLPATLTSAQIFYDKGQNQEDAKVAKADYEVALDVLNAFDLEQITDPQDLRIFYSLQADIYKQLGQEEGFLTALENSGDFEKIYGEAVEYDGNSDLLEKLIAMYNALSSQEESRFKNHPKYSKHWSLHLPINEANILSRRRDLISANLMAEKE